jgi:hypothetical protein
MQCGTCARVNFEKLKTPHRLKDIKGRFSADNKELIDKKN